MVACGFTLLAIIALFLLGVIRNRIGEKNGCCARGAVRYSCRSCGWAQVGSSPNMVVNTVGDRRSVARQPWRTHRADRERLLCSPCS